VIVKGLDHVYYWTRDMDRSVAFYRDVLGLSLARRDGDNWAEFDAGPVRFAIHGVVEGHPVQPGGGTAVFEVADVDEAKRLLEERGVEFGHSAEVAGYARYATFQDPDGNTIQVIEYAAAR
jgi:catechol 2,3-dioxygenase-like lactoylglutathione lyase family enzyme